MAFFSLDYALTASVLRGWLGAITVQLKVRDEGIVCDLRTLAQREEKDADHQREGVINEY